MCVCPNVVAGSIDCAVHLGYGTGVVFPHHINLVKDHAVTVPRKALLDLAASTCAFCPTAVQFRPGVDA